MSQALDMLGKYIKELHLQPRKGILKKKKNVTPVSLHGKLVAHGGYVRFH